MNRKMAVLRNVFLLFSFTLLLSFNSYAEVMITQDTGEDSIKSAEPQYAPGEVLVKFKEGADPDLVMSETQIKSAKVARAYSIKQAASDFRKEYKLEKADDGWYSFLGKNYKEVSDIPDEEIFAQAYKNMPEVEKNLYRTYKVALPEDVSVEEAVSQFKSNPSVEFAEPNYLLTPAYVPNDPLYKDQWAHRTTQAEQGWDIERGKNNIVVAVIDSGVDYNHKDLAANIWRDKINQPGRDFVDIETAFYVSCGWKLISGEDYTVHDGDPMDTNGHGTHVAGIIGAVGGNGIGVAGVAHNCRIMPLRASYRIIDGAGRWVSQGQGDDMNEAIRFAADNGAKVINISMGGGSGGQAEKEAIEYAYSKGVVIVAGAGNENISDEFYPAAWEKVIAVAATTGSDKKTYYSNYGDWIDVAAPGGENIYLDAIMSTYPTSIIASGYRAECGTSMASPYVAGLAALILSHDQNLTNEDVRFLIKASADDIGDPGKDQYFGYGRVNVRKALTPITLAVNIKSPVSGQYVRGNNYEVRGSAFISEKFNKYELYYAPKDDPSNITRIIDPHSNTWVKDPDGKGGLLGVWDTTRCREGKQYILTLKVENNDHIAIERNIEVIIDNINEPPVFTTAFKNTGAIIGQTTVIPVDAKDPDDPGTPCGQAALSVSHNLPSGTNFSYSASDKACYWAPTPNDKGIYSITFTAKDSENTVSKTIYISTVYPVYNHPPQIDDIEKLRISGDKLIVGFYGDRYFTPTPKTLDLSTNAYYEDVPIPAGYYSMKSQYFDPYDNKIVFLCEDGYSIGMYLYDFVGGASSKPTGEYSSCVIESIYDNSMMYDKSGEQRLLNIAQSSSTNVNLPVSVGTPYNVQIFKNKIKWVESNGEIYVYDHLSGNKVKITNLHKSGSNSGLLYEDTVAWLSPRDPLDHRGMYDLYMYDLKTGTETLVAEGINSGLCSTIKMRDGNIAIHSVTRCVTGSSDSQIKLYHIAKDMLVDVTEKSKFTDYAILDLCKNRLAYAYPHDDTIEVADFYFVPEVITVSPARVSAGDVITLDGKDFGYSQNDESKVIMQNGKCLDIVSWTDTQVQCKAPKGIGGSVYMKVVTSGGESNEVPVYINPNKPPQVTAIQNKECKEGATLTFYLEARDTDGGAMTASVNNLPRGAMFARLYTYASYILYGFSWTPASNQSGVYPVTFNVSDGYNTVSQTVVITVKDGPFIRNVSRCWGSGYNMGLTIYGDHFGSTAGKLKISGPETPEIKIYYWQDGLIVCRVPKIVKPGTYIVTATDSSGAVSNSYIVKVPN